MLKTGDYVLIDGEELRIETHWCQMKDRIYLLDDGREVRNLDQLVEQGKAKIVTPTIFPKLEEDDFVSDIGEDYLD